MRGCRLNCHFLRLVCVLTEACRDSFYEENLERFKTEKKQLHNLMFRFISSQQTLRRHQPLAACLPGKDRPLVFVPERIRLHGEGPVSGCQG